MIEEATGGGGEGMAPPPATSAATGARVVFAEAPWCGECKRMAPLVEAAAAAHPDVLFERVDLSADQAVAGALEIMATPTLIGFAGAAEVARVAGRRGPDEIEQLLAATESGTRPPSRPSRTDVVLRVGAGVLLVALGVPAGPSWPLLGLGAAVSGSGLVGLLPRGR